MGKVPLLTREQEVEICKRIEDAQNESNALIYSLGFARKEHALAEARLRSAQERFDRVSWTRKIEKSRSPHRDLRKLIKSQEVDHESDQRTPPGAMLNKAQQDKAFYQVQNRVTKKLRIPFRSF